MIELLKTETGESSLRQTGVSTYVHSVFFPVKFRSSYIISCVAIQSIEHKLVL